MSDKYMNEVSEHEISVKNILFFFLESWKAIVATSLIGLLGGAAFFALTPPKFEAIAQIQMMQISPGGNINSNNSGPLSVNVEDPLLLITRLKLPSSFQLDEIKVCGIDQENSPAELLSDLLKLSPIKGVGSIVELRIRLSSKEQAINCVDEIFKNIRNSQNYILEPYIHEAKVLLSKYQERLRDAQALVARADKSGAALSAAYLASRDEIKFLTDESIRLNTFIATANVRQAKLIAPIYASSSPVYPVKRQSLVTGFLSGLFLGVFLALTRKIWNNFQFSGASQVGNSF